MDETAAKLLQELGGSLQGDSGPGPPSATTAGTAAAEDLDRWRMLLVEMVYLLNACFRDVQYWEGIKTEKDTFRQFGGILLQLARLPDHDGAIRINHRGATQGKLSEKADYLVRFGEISIDTAIIAAVIKRLGIRMKHLEGRLQKSFDTLAAEGIDSILLRIPEDTPESMDGLRGVLRVLSCYRPAAEKNSPITYSRNGKPMQLTPVHDDQGQPDPNLTMLAAVNDLSADAMQEHGAQGLGLDAAAGKRPPAPPMPERVSDVLRHQEPARQTAAAADRSQRQPAQFDGHSGGRTGLGRRRRVGGWRRHSRGRAWRCRRRSGRWSGRQRRRAAMPAAVQAVVRAAVQTAKPEAAPCRTATRPSWGMRRSGRTWPAL